MPKDKYFRLSTCDDNWFCQKCILPNFTDSFFFSSENSIVSESSFISGDNLISVQINSSIDSSHDEPSKDDPCDIFKDFRELRETDYVPPKYNSLRYKFNDLKPILTDNCVTF